MPTQLQNLKTAIASFKKVEACDLTPFSSFKPISDFISCEYNPANLAIWNELYDIIWTPLNGVPLVNIARDDALLFPHIQNLSSPLLREVSYAMMDSGFSGKITQTPSEFIEHHPELAEFFTIEPDADFADYIYEADKLASLSGAALSKKRNLIAQFKREFGEPDAVELAESHSAACLALAERTLDAESPASTREELSALKRSFELFDVLRLTGTAVFAAGKLMGFSIVSKHIDGTCCVHFEKTLGGVKGAAQVVNQKTAERLIGKCEFINREQDLGLPGLRRAKRSYKPARILLNHILSPKRIP